MMNQIDPQAIDQFLLEKMDTLKIPGLALGVQIEETSVYRGYHGFANLEHQVPVGPETVWEIASITKPFTAQGILLAAEQGLVTLDASLSEYLGGLPEAWQGITLRHCLAHQSGIPSYTEVARYWEVTQVDKSPEQLLSLVRELPQKFKPGERYQYDNTGYYLLGMVLEAVYQQPFGDIVRSMICAPLGLSGTRANSYAELIPKRAAGYQLKDGQLINKPFYSLSNTFSAGCLLSTLPDLFLWQRALVSDSLLTGPSRDRMHHPHSSQEQNERKNNFSMGLGWFLVDHPLGFFIGHNGSILGTSSSFAYFPERDLTLVSLFNQSDVESPHLLPFETLKRFWG